MKVVYDGESDTLLITFREERVKESDEVRPGVIADFGYDGAIVRLEVLDASKLIGDPESIEFVSRRAS
jgi:uncharacterized protein YuzE